MHLERILQQQVHYLLRCSYCRPTAPGPSTHSHIWCDPEPARTCVVRTLPHGSFLALLLSLWLASAHHWTTSWSRHELRKAQKRLRRWAATPSITRAVRTRARSHQHHRILSHFSQFCHQQAPTQTHNPTHQNSLAPNRHPSCICHRSSFRHLPHPTTATRSRLFHRSLRFQIRGTQRELPYTCPPK